MKRLAILADDLTGALDTAAQFSGRFGPVETFWRESEFSNVPSVVAVDSGTRDYRDRQFATAVVRSLARLVLPPVLKDGGILFKKIDSQFRGHTWNELAVCIDTVKAARCIIAPAFPFQGRVTRGGRQFCRQHGDDWAVVGDNPVSALRELGIWVQLRSPGDPIPDGVSVWDAETDDDLRLIVSAERNAPGGTLWCGSGGLGGALADTAPVIAPMPKQPVLGLFGSNHAVTQEQLKACNSVWMVLQEPSTDVREIRHRLALHGVALVSVGVSPGRSRLEAAAAIAQRFSSLTEHVDRPRTLLVSGGETLHSLCLSLEAQELKVFGQIIPGVACAKLCGGRWDGVDIVAKSGSFGARALLANLVGLKEELSV